MSKLLHKLSEVCMKKSLFGQKTTTITLALMIVIVFCLICCGVGVAFAENSTENNIKIVHISDLHYYPTYMCYKQSNSDYDSSAMVKKGDVEGKLLTESSSILKKLFEDILNIGNNSDENIISQNASKAPDYLVVTGDLSSDGEKVALIEMANALRDLQNKMRVTYNNNDFQIFVIPGNHDINNPDAKDYSVLDGQKVDSVSREEFAKIFAGLGYKNMTEDEAEGFYADYESSFDNNNIKYLPYQVDGNKKYVHSQNATSIKFDYKADSLNGDAIADGDLTYVAKTNNTTFVAIDGVVSGEVGGRLNDNVFAWLKGKIADNQNGNIISLTHHNVLPHFTMQEQWTKNYLFSNWESVRDFFVSNKIMYNFSGHMHANDVASYCDYDGYRLYDMETGCPVGYGAIYREVGINFLNNGDSDLVQIPRTISKVNVKTLIDDGYLTLNAVEKNDEIVDNTIVSVADYINEKLYITMADSMLDNVIINVSKKNVAEKFVHYIEGYFPNNVLIAKNKELLQKICENLYDQIQEQTLKDFAYSGEKKFLQGPDNKLRAYVYNFAKSVIDINIAKNYTLQNLVVEAFTTHLKGGEDKSLSYQNSNLALGVEWMQNGGMVRDIFDIINNKGTGIRALVKNVLAANYNLTNGLKPEEIRMVDILLASRNCSLSSFNLDKLLKGVLGDEIDKLPSDYVDGKINYLVSDSIAKGIGENISNLVVSLVTDGSDDGFVDVGIKVLYVQTDDHTYYATGKVTPATIEDGRLPSMLTMTFGDNKSADRNFVWFTDKNITNTAIQICKGDKLDFDKNNSEKKIILGKCDIYAVDFPLAELGVIATYTTKELARHTLSLTGLDSNTTYSYRVGDNINGFWSEVYTFKTRDTVANKPFEVLITTDSQGMTQKAYQNHAKLLEATNQASQFGYDFVLNLGDLVDDSRNLNQWKYLLDSSRWTYASMPQVIAPGNHDMGKFEAQEGYVPSSDDVVTDYSQLDLHFNIGSKTYYSFDYQKVHFVVLDTNTILGENNLGLEQVEWLENDLKQNEDNLVVVVMHKGIYSAGPHKDDAEIVKMRKILTKLFDKYKVEIVLQGHDHTYSESFFLDGEGKKTNTSVYKQGAPINNNDAGVLYVTMGSSGDKFYDFDTNTDDYINKGKMFHSPKLDKPTFGRLVFDGNDIKFYAYEYDIANDKIEQLILFSPNQVSLIVSIVVAIVIVAGMGLVVFFLLRNHKKKIALCVKQNEMYDKDLQSDEENTGVLDENPKIETDKDE